jgi:hypothetical protein
MEEEAELALDLVAIHLKSHPDSKPNKDCLFCQNFVIQENQSKVLGSTQLVIFDLFGQLDEEFLTEMGWKDFHYYNKDSFYCKKDKLGSRAYYEIMVGKSGVEIVEAADYLDEYQGNYRKTLYRGMMNKSYYALLCLLLKIY